MRPSRIEVRSCHRGTEEPHKTISGWDHDRSGGGRLCCW